jgi:hypothetical protein
MPYELSFTQPVAIASREDYINDCCIGGDVVVDRLAPAIRERYADVDTGQEDWGWFIWFRRGPVRLAVDVFTDDPDTGAFRIRLTSRRRRWLWLDAVVDTPELDALRDLVSAELRLWTGRPVDVTHDRDR